MTTTAPPSPADLELLREHLAGSTDAFTQLVKRHVDMVYSAALRQVRDSHLADDVTQAVFLLLWQKAATLKAGTILAGWLHRATQYCAANALRLRSIRQQHEQRAATMTPRVNESRDPDALEQAELASVVDQAVEQLGATDRAAVVLRYFAGKSVHEVATALNVTPEAARKRIDRALDKLQTIVKRLGVSTAAPALVAFLTTHSLHTAPAHVASSIAATLAAASTGSTAGVGAAGTIAKGALVAMTAKTKLAAIAAALAFLLLGGAVVYTTTTKPAAQRAAPSVAQTSIPQNTVRIQAYIDGRSRLVVRGNTVQWQHFEYNVPGGFGTVARPTVINGKQWYPGWLGFGMGGAINVSNLYDKMDPPLPATELSVTVRPVTARGKISVVQLPAANNNFALIIEFDDGPEAGPATYTADIAWTPAEAPPTFANLPTHKYADGSIHRGEMKNGQRDGKGEMTWAAGPRKGDKYQGEWKADEPDGTGIYTYADGSRYDGEFKKGLRGGKGSIVWTAGPHKGDRYAGEWKADKMDGTGRLVYADGGEYHGEFHADLRDGKGAMLWTTGPRKKYEGEWKADKPDGAGAYTNGDGSTYQGIIPATRPTASNAH